MLHAFKSVPWTHCILSPHISRYLTELQEGYRSYEEPYLLRFRIYDKIYIMYVLSNIHWFIFVHTQQIRSEWFWSQSHLSWLLNLLWHAKHHFAVDIMFTGRERAIWCRVPREKAFNVTGHYPILAGFGAEKALYVADDGLSNRNPHMCRRQ